MGTIKVMSLSKIPRTTNSPPAGLERSCLLTKAWSRLQVYLPFSCPKCRLGIEPVALPTRGGEAAFKPFSPDLTSLFQAPR